MVRTIPAREEIVCDVCGRVNATRKIGGRLIVKQNGLDHLGDPVCDDSRTFDLCDKCHLVVVEALNNAMEKIREDL